MKLILGIFLTLLCATAFTQKSKNSIIYDVKLLRVSDGDTVVFQASFLPEPLKPELALRIYGVDTPEKGFRAKCESENIKGQLATGFTKQMVASAKSHQVALMDWDKFGGRVLGDLILDGKSLRQMLIANGHAREYYGEAKQSWCN